MKPPIKLPIPEPGESEFENFDRLVGVLLKAKPRKVAKKGVQHEEHPATAQERTHRVRRLPRP